MKKWPKNFFIIHKVSQNSYFLARYLVSIALENHENDENIVKNVDF